GLHCLVIQNGKVFAWGDNRYGQLGNRESGEGVHSTVPVAVKDPSGVGKFSGVPAIAAGGSHSLAIKDGNVYAWGDDRFGTLGNGDDLGDSNVPVLVLDLEVDLIDVAAGEFSSYALAADGSLWVWGWNVEGQLGLGYTETPAKVLGQCKCVY